MPPADDALTIPATFERHADPTVADGIEKQPGPGPRTSAWLAFLQGVIPVVSAVAAGLWVAATYLQDQREQAAGREALLERQQSELEQQNRIRSFEAGRSFRDRQFELYMETASVAGLLVTVDPTDAEWRAAARRFWQLFWSELSVVEDGGVKSAMQDFGPPLRAVESAEPAEKAAAQARLQQPAYRLAQALRASIRESWSLR